VTRSVSYTTRSLLANRTMVFDNLRRSFDELISRATKPEERRAIAARMKDTLIQARLGLDDMRSALDRARKQLTLEERELQTIRRRKQLAEGISDKETVDLAVKYEQMHAERVEVMRRKVEAQEAELALAEREVGSMSAELRQVITGAPMPNVPPPTDADLGLAEDPTLRDEIDSLGRARARQDRDAEADRRLEELKRRMGK
jgi:hypothetical protein